MSSYGTCSRKHDDNVAKNWLMCGVETWSFATVALKDFGANGVVSRRVVICVGSGYVQIAMKILFIARMKGFFLKNRTL